MRKEPPRLEGALIALDPTNGEVRAIVGGRDTQSVGLNRALQTKRQPGSAFKPFVYAAALESGYAPASVIDRLNSPIDTYQGAWLPEDEHSTADSMTMRTALRTSSNRAAVRMLETVGIERAVGYAKQLGVGTVPSVPSLALGSGEVTLASMTSAYAAFAQGGIVRDPVFIKRVEDQDGTVLFQADANPRRAVSETTAFLMATMLADVIDAGTGTRARTRRLQTAGRRQDGHDERFCRCMVRRIHAEDCRGRVDRVRSAPDDRQERARRPPRGTDVGEIHESRDQKRRRHVVRAAWQRRACRGVPLVWTPAWRRLRQRAINQHLRR